MKTSFPLGSFDIDILVLIFDLERGGIYGTYCRTDEVVLDFGVKT